MLRKGIVFMNIPNNSYTNRAPNSNTGGENGGTAYLTVKVRTASNAIPIEGATVTVRENENDGEVLYNLVTDRDGATSQMSFSVPPKANSEIPLDSGQYGTVNIEVSYPGYYPMFYSAVPVFDTILAVQTVDLIPISDSGNNTVYRFDESRSFNTEPNTL